MAARLTRKVSVLSTAVARQSYHLSTARFLRSRTSEFEFRATASCGVPSGSFTHNFAYPFFEGSSSWYFGTCNWDRPLNSARHKTQLREKVANRVLSAQWNGSFRRPLERSCRSTSIRPTCTQHPVSARCPALHVLVCARFVVHDFLPCDQSDFSCFRRRELLHRAR